MLSFQIPPTKTNKRTKANPPNQYNRKGIARANKPSPTPTPSPHHQRKADQVQETKKNGYSVQENGSPKK
jgi:hypothetical protein